MTITLTANEYLDARQPSWVPAEKAGRIRYDAVTRHVMVTDDATIRDLRA